MATTYDFDITRNAEVGEAIARLDAQTNDRVYALIYQNGNLVLTRRNANYFGSEKEMTVQNGVGYTLLMAPDESDKFTAGVAATYKMYLVDADGVPTEIINGTITVEPRAGETAPDYVVEQRAVLHVTGSALPSASLYAEGTIVSYDGLIYIQRSGSWVNDAATSNLLVENLLYKAVFKKTTNTGDYSIVPIYSAIGTATLTTVGTYKNNFELSFSALTDPEDTYVNTPVFTTAEFGTAAFVKTIYNDVSGKFEGQTMVIDNADGNLVEYDDNLTAVFLIEIYRSAV